MTTTLTPKENYLRMLGRDPRVYAGLLCAPCNALRRRAFNTAGRAERTHCDGAGRDVCGE